MAKMRCVKKCQFKGDIVHEGDIVETDEKELKEAGRTDNFVTAGATEKPSAAPAIIVAGLTRAQAILKLQTMKIAVGDNMTDEEVAKIFLAAADAAQKRGNEKRK